ncbi:hypothetical protein NDU88_005937 [Pleurodeles waltl]|uniref:Uncharacterized protein n=1 Tax=Pleurodeles waltl TaxID=8319 RepID=A0AAV7SNA6_PLEWA|nr:hypothetical protein NDU88_005937 [Pleurodeles waltl]
MKITNARNPVNTTPCVVEGDGVQEGCCGSDGAPASESTVDLESEGLIQKLPSQAISQEKPSGDELAKGHHKSNQLLIKNGDDQIFMQSGIEQFANWHGKDAADQAQAKSCTLLEIILQELRELKVLQRKETAAINQRLDTIEAVIGQTPAHLQELQQIIWDPEDPSLVWDSKLGRLQKKLSDSQNEIDDMEYYTRRSNLCFVGVQKRSEKQGNHQDMLQFINALVKT